MIDKARRPTANTWAFAAAGMLLIVLTIVGWRSYTYLAVDRSLFTDIPCAAPCWHGIVPGTTSSSEALAILEANPYVRKSTLVQNGTPVLGGARWYWRVSGYRLQPGLTWQNDRVREIVLGLPYHVDIAQIIEKYGPPEALIATSGGIPENRYWIIDLLHPQLGLQFKTYTADDNAIISPTTEVGAAYYFAPTTLNTRLEAYYGHNTSTDSNIGVELAREWNGYGDLFDKYYTSPKELFVDE